MLRKRVLAGTAHRKRILFRQRRIGTLYRVEAHAHRFAEHGEGKGLIAHPLDKSEFTGVTDA